MTSLYNLADQYMQLANRLADLDLDLTTIKDTIESSGIVDEFKDKAQALEFVARGAQAHNSAIDAEIARLTALKARRDGVATGLRKYLLDTMLATGITKIECPLFSIATQNNPVAVDVFDVLILPATYMKTPELKLFVAAPDKAAIKAAIQLGQEVPGAKLTQSVRLVVK